MLASVLVVLIQEKSDMCHSRKLSGARFCETRLVVVPQKLRVAHGRLFVIHATDAVVAVAYLGRLE